MTKILCHKVCKKSYFKTSTIIKFKMPTKLAIFLIGTLAFIVANLLLSFSANAYQLPIQQHLNRERHRLTNTQHVLEPKKPSFNQPLNVPGLSFGIQRRSGDAQKEDNSNGILNGAYESDELRELHQAVDTVAKLLNEEEQQQKERQQQQNQLQQQQQQQHGFDNQRIDLAESSLNVLKTQPELLSESAIREAIKQLERVQQQERREAMEAESKLRPTIVDNPSGASSDLDSASTHLQPEPLKAKQATLSGLVEELGDEFANEQVAAATQGAEYVPGQAHMPRTSGQSDENNNKQQNNKKEEQKLSAPQESQYTSSTPTSYQKQPQQEVVQPSPQNSNDKSLLVGQLDSLASELGPALTNDFYTFHADSNGGSERGDSAPVETLSSAQNNQYQDQSASSPKQQTIQSQSDLESAAQTRNSITQQDPAQIPFRQDSNTIRFDFNQPASVDPQQLPQSQPITNNQEGLIRAFRQQTGANIGNEQYPTTTLIPISGQDSFWRPTEGSQAGDIGQQYNRALASAPQTLPPLPQSRFQSSNLSGQFSQPASSSRQAQHIHYTGHSLIPSAQNTPQFQASPQVGSNRDRAFVSTTAPLISVLSGSDTSRGNSVLWNPPATLNPPSLAPQPQPQSPFIPRTQTSTQSPGPDSNGDVAQFYPPPNHGPPSPLFSGSFPGVTESTLRNPANDRNFRSPQSQSIPPTSTEANSNLDVTTEGRFAPPTTTAQWSPSAASEPPVERDVSDSQPRSSFRSSQSNNQRFFSPNDLVGPSSTLSSVNTELPRISRQNNTPTVITTTPSSSAPNSTAKKEDMVIYYYYYYDDNKNATVVAKNVTSSPSAASPSNLDAAIEADGGIEDTPYMDDPAPIINPRPNSPPTSTTPSTTTSTTTTTASPLFISSTFPSSIHDNRFKNSVASSRAPSGNEYTGGVGRQTTFDRELSSNQFSDFVKPTFVEQPRAPVITPNRGPSSVSRERQSVAEQSFTSTPLSAPSTSSFKPISRVPANRDSHTSNRVTSTESSTFHSSTTHSTPSRLDSGNHQRHQQSIAHSNPAPSLPNTKLQTDLIQNVLNGINSPQPRQVLNFPTAPTPVLSTANSISGSTSSSSSTGRSPLSNASRYGTNNNLMLDPYGLDPAAPATLIHSSHATDTPVSHHKNWQPTASQGVSHQFNRKPAAVTEASAVSSTSSSENLSSARPQIPNATRTISQPFASQRNSNAAINVSPTVSRMPQPQPGSRVSGSNKQFFPESNNQVFNSAVDQNRNEQSVRIPPKQASFEQNPSPPKAQPSRQTSSIPSDDFNGNRLTPEEFTPRLQSTNGRPSTPDGNTGNGFTRSPINITPISTPAPSVSTSSIAQISSISESISSSPLPTTPLSISTSVSKSFVTPQQVQVTTSISQPTVTSTASSTSTSQLSSITPATLPQQSISSVQTSISNVPSTTSSSSSTTTTTSTAAQEASQPTESSDSANTSTRKKFGNRTNRFQTRLNSLSASRSTSTTTTTTPGPSVSSTTRRPTTSTTRKSSKQLFPGRRRLNSIQQPTDIANSSATATAVSSSSITASNSASDSPSTSTSGRSRFGNSFAARTRLSTPSSTQSQEQSSTTQRPASLFGAQRATSKPRLPFLKPSKPVATATNGTVDLGQNLGDSPSGNSSNPTPMDTVPATLNSEKPMIDKSTVNETGSEDSSEDTSTGSGEDESADMKKDPASPTTSNNSMVSEAVVTAAPSPSTVPDAPSSRNKPKLRPLFASRQRSSSLFGNRRSNSTSTTTN